MLEDGLKEDIKNEATKRVKRVTRGISDVIYEDVENRVVKTVTNVLGRTKYVEYRVDRTVSSI